MLHWGKSFFFLPTTRSILGPIKKYLDVSMTLKSIYLARSYYLFFFTIPVSYFTYLLNKNCFKFGTIPSFISAIIIAILPSQVQNPRFVDGNGVLITLVFLLPGVYFLTKYLESGNKKSDLFLSFCFYFLSNHIGGERALLIAPAIILMILIYRTKVQQKIYGCSVVFINVCLMIIWYMHQKGSVEARPVNLNPTVIFWRFKSSVIWAWIKTTNIENWLIIFIVLLAFIFVGLILGYKERVASRANIAGIFFYIGGAICSSLPFWFVSKYFSVRYFYISHAFLWSVLIYSAYLLLKTMRLKQLTIFCILLTLLLYTGIEKHKTHSKFNHKQNLIFDGISHTLNTIDLLPNPQIYLSGLYPNTGQYYIWCSVYLMHLTGRDDIRGVIGPPCNFYNPLNPSHRTYSYRMEGLDPQLPIYGIAIFKNHVKFYNYYLQWMEKGKKESKWNLYIKDAKSHTLKLFHSGTGLQNYEKFILKNKLKSEDVLWGNLKFKYLLGVK